VPSGDTWKADMALSFAALCDHTARQGIDVGFINERMCGISHSRNSHVTDALAMDLHFTHLMWVDSDMAFPVDALVRLLAHDKPIAGCFYPQKAPPFHTVGCPEDSNDVSGDGLIRAKMLGGGFVLVKREVYETIKYPWYEERFTAEPRGFISEDAMFCYKCRVADVDMWIDLDLSRSIGHSGNNLVSFSKK
jgi:hypothetical protein